jgi:hypothetical protein
MKFREMQKSIFILTLRSTEAKFVHISNKLGYSLNNILYLPMHLKHSSTTALSLSHTHTLFFSTPPFVLSLSVILSLSIYLSLCPASYLPFCTISPSVSSLLLPSLSLPICFPLCLCLSLFASSPLTLLSLSLCLIPSV